MKILYGVQGTGNGHITRARALNQYFTHFGLQVDFLFSGRDASRYFDMQEFGSGFRTYKGLTFAYQAGGIKIIRTLMDNDFRGLRHDIRNLDLTPYDLVLTDFEPISAHAARNQGVPCIGVGHQYAFLHDIPIAGETLIGKSVLRHFAPANQTLGLHWHHFDAPILPPIAEAITQNAVIEDDKILVYLGFEDTEEVIRFLEPFDSQVFVIYGPFAHYQSWGHIQLKPLSREDFCADLASCNGVISNAGFELASEAIQLGKKLLVKPLQGQMEQQSNAQALAELNLGMSMPKLDKEIAQRWLNSNQTKRISYPNVAQAIVRWISQGNWMDVGSLSEALWAKTQEVDLTQERPVLSSPAA